MGQIRGCSLGVGMCEESSLKAAEGDQVLFEVRSTTGRDKRKQGRIRHSSIELSVGGRGRMRKKLFVTIWLMRLVARSYASGALAPDWS